MLQSLIEERFKLRFHREMREFPVYELTVSKNGTKLKTAIEQGPPQASDTKVGRGTIELKAQPMQNFVYWLSRQLDRPLIDKTNVKGIYDIKLIWTAELSSAPRGTPELQQTPPIDSVSIFSALTEQLGLKLESAKGPVEVLVIDSVQKPSEN